ncbi:MAG: hypothetical protein ACXWKP_22645 [Bradyrhizobium sp.]
MHRNGALKLAAVGDLAWRRGFGFGRFECRAYLFGAREGPADISIFRTDIKRNQPIAVLAVGLESVADPLRPFAEYLRAFGAFDFHFFVDHECPWLNAGTLLSQVLKSGIRIC